MLWGAVIEFSHATLVGERSGGYHHCRLRATLVPVRRERLV
jgi:hypothetical protein